MKSGARLLLLLFCCAGCAAFAELSLSSAPQVLSCGECPSGSLGSCVFPTLLNETTALYSLHCAANDPVCQYPSQDGPGNLSSIVVYSGVVIVVADDCKSLLWDLSAVDNSSITFEAGSSVNGRQISLLAAEITVHSTAVLNATGRGLDIGASAGFGGSGVGSGGTTLSSEDCANSQYVVDETVFAEYYSVDPFESFSLTGTCAVSTGANSNTSAAGGCLLLTASSTLTMNGILEADGSGCGKIAYSLAAFALTSEQCSSLFTGLHANGTCDLGGGGGSIGVSTKILNTADTSSISARGGDANGPAGGGGRIALKYDFSKTPSPLLGAVSSAGGLSKTDCGRGGAGTILRLDTSGASAASLTLSARETHTRIRTITAFDTEKELGLFDSLSVFQNTTVISQALKLSSLEVQEGSTLLGLAPGTASSNHVALAITALEINTLAGSTIFASELSLSGDGEGDTNWSFDVGTSLVGSESAVVSFASTSDAHFGAQINPELVSADSILPTVHVQNTIGNFFLDATATASGGEVQFYSGGSLFVSGRVIASSFRGNRYFRLDACTAEGLSMFKYNASLSIQAEQSITFYQTAFLSGPSIAVAAARSLSMDKGSRILSDALGYRATMGPGAGGSAETTSSSGGGAGYGGAGGEGVSESGEVTAGGDAYGEMNLYAFYGSGGGDGGNSESRGGSGGGSICLCSLSKLDISANISAKGAAGASSAGGGAGGSIALVGPMLSGSGGMLMADGGKGGVASSGSTVPSYGGGGAGGRIFLSIVGSSTTNAVDYTPSVVSLNGGDSGMSESSTEIGQGESGTILFPSCPPGYGNQLEEPYRFCQVCNAGTYSDSLDTGECSTCANAPKHSSYTGTGQVSSTCPYTCEVGFSPPDCKKPLESILASIGGWYVLVAIVVTFLAFFLVVVAMWRHFLQKRREAYSKGYYLDENTVFHHVFMSERLHAAEEGKSSAHAADSAEYVFGAEDRYRDPFTSHEQVNRNSWRRLSRKTSDTESDSPARGLRRALLGFPHAESEPDSDSLYLVSSASTVAKAFLSVFNLCGTPWSSEREQDSTAHRSPSTTGRAFGIGLGLDYGWEKELMNHKLTKADLAYHAGRIVLSGTNTPDNPWTLNPRVPKTLKPILDEFEWQKFALDLNRMARWPFWEEALLRGIQLVCNPVYHLLLEGQRRSRAMQLFRLLSSYDQAAFKGTQAQLDHCLRLTMSLDYTVACLDLLHKEGLESPFQPLTRVGQPSVPILLRFSGLATYCCPLCLDTSDVLVKSIPHMPSLTSFISESWSEFLKGLNEELRVVHWRSIKRDLQRVNSYLSSWNRESAEKLGGLAIELVYIESLAFFDEEPSGETAALLSRIENGAYEEYWEVLPRLGIAIDVDATFAAISGNRLEKLHLESKEDAELGAPPDNFQRTRTDSATDADAAAETTASYDRYSRLLKSLGKTGSVSTSFRSSEQEQSTGSSTSPTPSRGDSTGVLSPLMNRSSSAEALNSVRSASDVEERQGDLEGEVRTSWPSYEGLDNAASPPSAMLHPCKRVLIAEVEEELAFTPKSRVGKVLETVAHILSVMSLAVHAKHRRVTLDKSLMRPLRFIIFLLVAYDITANLNFLINIWCVGGENDEDGCKHNALYWYLFLYPFASIVAPLAALAAIILEYRAVFIQAILWNSLSIVNSVVACFLVMYYPQLLYVQVMVFLMTINKMVLNNLMVYYHGFDSRYRGKFMHA